jgi:hypothetical protein
MHIPSISRLMVLAGGVAAALLVSGNATADSRVYPGTVCHSNETLAASPQYGVFNDTTAAITAYCPINRLQDTTPWTSMTFSFYDRSTTSNVSCFIWTYAADGSSASSIPLSTTGNSLSSQTITKTSSATSASASVQVVVECTIPGQESGSYPSHVVSIAVSD